jgi:3D (Asp-Asp-Asp) domain-containing protein
VEGKVGRERIVYKTVTAADGSTKAKAISRECLAAPVTQVVRVGTAPSVKTENGYKRVKKKLTVQATAYWTHDPVDASGTGIAYDGTPAVPYKTIAVDPRVIPLQSQVYIPGIGQVRANDTGSAIKGKIIDIAMDSRNAAWDWGRRNIEIYILDEK